MTSPFVKISGIKKTVVGVSALLLMAFICFGIYTWVRTVRTIPYSSNCLTKLVQISRQSSAVRPFFIGAFLVNVVVFESISRQIRGSWRLAYLILLGFGAALLVAPWIVNFFYVRPNA